MRRLRTRPVRLLKHKSVRRKGNKIRRASSGQRYGQLGRFIRRITNLRRGL
jgi:hypothetical protein